MTGMLGKIAVGTAVALAGACAEAQDFHLGAGFHFGSSATGDVEANMNLFEQAGLDAGRDERGWQFVEWDKNDIRCFKNHKIECMINRLHRNGGIYVNGLWYGNRWHGDGDYPRTPENIEAFSKYAEFVTRETKGLATFQQVWNEWDAGTGMPAQYKDTAAYNIYVNLLKAVAPRIRAADPGVKIMSTSATMVFKLENLLKAGTLKYVDAIAFHPYVCWRGPGNDTVEYWNDLMIEARKVIRNYNNGNDFPVYITELGWSSAIGKDGYSEERQSVYAAQMLLLVRSFPFVKGLIWYDFQDDGIDPLNPETNYGLIRSDTTPKPLYYIFADLAHLVRHGSFIERVNVKDAKVVVLKFELDGKDVYAMWNWYANRNTEIVFRNNAANPPAVAVRHAGRKAVTMNWGRCDWLRKEERKNNELCFTLRDLPLIIAGDLKTAKIAGIRNVDFRCAPDNLPAPEPSPQRLMY